MSADTLRRVLELQNRTPLGNAAFHLDSLVAHAPLKALAECDEDIRASKAVSRETEQRIGRRRALARRSGEELWADLQDLSERSKHKRYTSEIDQAYADDLIEALGAHDVPSVETICERLGSSEGAGGWLEIFLVDLAGVRRTSEAIPALVANLGIEADYLRERSLQSLGRIGDPEAVRLIQKRFPQESETFRLFASGVLGRIKHEASETAVLAVLETEKDVTVRTDLCYDLCLLFSQRAVDVVRHEIRAGYDRTLVRLEDQLLVVAEVLGVSLPEEHQWRREREEIERRQRERRAELAELGRRYAELRKRGIDPLKKFRAGALEAGGSRATRPAPAPRQPAPVGRNDPCPCGSGRKYKRCCGPRNGRPQGG